MKIEGCVGVEDMIFSYMHEELKVNVSFQFYKEFIYINIYTCFSLTNMLVHVRKEIQGGGVSHKQTTAWRLKL